MTGPGTEAGSGARRPGGNKQKGREGPRGRPGFEGRSRRDRTQPREDFDEEIQQEFRRQPQGEAPAPPGHKFRGNGKAKASRDLSKPGGVGGRHHESPGSTPPDWKREMMAELGKRLGNHHSQTPDDLAEQT
ncbi:hypothetical protein PanWU01x14_366410, partial [Parasponia andersonii]